jgi:hypothetical protein
MDDCASVSRFQAVRAFPDCSPINGQPIYWDIAAPPRYDPSKSVNALVCQSCVPDDF